MTYSYEIFEEDDGIKIKEQGSIEAETWHLHTIKNYLSFSGRCLYLIKGNPSFVRTTEWLKANHPELMI